MDRGSRRAELYSLLGDLPERHRDISSETIDVSERDGYVIERLVLDLNGIEPVPALFLRPTVPPSKGDRFPVVLYNHAHGGQFLRGKDELTEGTTTGSIFSPPYAAELTGAGYAALCIDAWNFGERRGRAESELFKQMLWRGQVLWGLMVYDSLRAIDYLSTRPDVDASRIGTIGLSMGSTMAWWVAALDDRVTVCVDICCLTDFDTLVEARGLDGHGIYYYVPGLLKHFTTAEINQLIAPRPHLSLAGIFDPLTPPQGLDRIDAEVSKAYEEEGAADRWQLFRSPSGHFETAEMRSLIRSFLQRWL